MRQCSYLARSLNASIVHPREVCRPAIMASAHPSSLSTTTEAGTGAHRGGPQRSGGTPCSGRRTGGHHGVLDHVVIAKRGSVSLSLSGPQPHLTEERRRNPHARSGRTAQHSKALLVGSGDIGETSQRDPMPLFGHRGIGSLSRGARHLQPRRAIPEAIWRPCALFRPMIPRPPRQFMGPRVRRVPSNPGSASLARPMSIPCANAIRGLHRRTC